MNRGPIKGHPPLLNQFSFIYLGIIYKRFIVILVKPKVQEIPFFMKEYSSAAQSTPSLTIRVNKINCNWYYLPETQDWRKFSLNIFLDWVLDKHRRQCLFSIDVPVEFCCWDGVVRGAVCRNDVSCFVSRLSPTDNRGPVR